MAQPNGENMTQVSAPHSPVELLSTQGLKKKKRWLRDPPEGVHKSVVILRIASPFLLLALWQISSMVSESILFPSATEVLLALWDMAISGELWVNLWISNQALVIGASASLIVGILMGVLLGRSKRLNQILGIYVSIDLATPTIALLPLIIIIFGLDLTARSVVVFTFGIAMVISLVRTGAQTVDEGLAEMGEAFAPTRWQMWSKVIIPGLLPALGGAIRIAVSRGVVGMVIVELILISVGIGGQIMDARALFQGDRVYAGVIVICIEALLLMAAGRWLERKIAPQGMYGSK